MLRGRSAGDARGSANKGDIRPFQRFLGSATRNIENWQDKDKDMLPSLIQGVTLGCHILISGDQEINVIIGCYLAASFSDAV